MRNRSVLLLNQNYEPLNVTTVRRAIGLILTGKAQVLEEDSEWIRSPRFSMRAPSVLRLHYYVKRPFPELKVTRKGLLARDDHTCQYCGRRGGGLTIDHVIPRSRGGRSTWENMVTCCVRCNNRKGGRTPEEAGMKLIRKPFRPRFVPYMNYAKFVAAYRQHREWWPYLAPYAKGLLLEE
jgi:5-methylcytosine-specific restriction endonuclease McrA